MILELIHAHVVQLRAAGVIDNRDAANVCLWFCIHQSSWLRLFTAQHSFIICYFYALLIGYLLLPVEPTSVAYFKDEIQPSTSTKYSSGKEKRNS